MYAAVSAGRSFPHSMGDLIALIARPERIIKQTCVSIKKQDLVSVSLLH